MYCRVLTTAGPIANLLPTWRTNDAVKTQWVTCPYMWERGLGRGSASQQVGPPLCNSLCSCSGGFSQQLTGESCSRVLLQIAPCTGVAGLGLGLWVHNCPLQ